MGKIKRNRSQVQGSTFRVREKTEIEFQICGDMKAVGFPVQNAYKMAYGDQNTTFEPLNL
jgi:hypothetical protein